MEEGQHYEGNTANEVGNTKIRLGRDEFKLLRYSLRAFGLWQPERAGAAERWLYPGCINFLLLCSFLFDCVMFTLHLLGGGAKHDLLLELSVRLLLSCYYWICHIFTVKFFKNREFENDMLDVRTPGDTFITRLNCLLVISHVTSLTVTLLSIKTGILDHFPATWSTSKTTELETALYDSNYIGNPFNIFEVTISLSLSWIVYIQYEINKMRLGQLKRDFTSWETAPEDAIYHYQSVYASRVQRSSIQIQALFSVHNIFMVLLTPQFFYMCIEIGRKKRLVDFIIFLVYLVELFAAWILPLLFAHGIRSREADFVGEVNDICGGYIAEALHVEELDSFTFAKRKNVQKLVDFLKDRKAGLIIWGFAFQMKLSTWSFYLGIIMFIIKFVNV